jgi:CRISPR-associated protein Cmr4
MFKKAAILFLYTETPLHPGSGSSVAAVDLPVQRERHTNFPMIQASGVKGALRDLGKDLLNITDNDLQEFRRLRAQSESDMDNGDKQKKQALAEKILPWEIVFGPETDRASEHGGALALTDARILLFPVRSVKGVFTWITCPGVIARLCRDLELLKINGKHDLNVQPLQGIAGWQLESRQVAVPTGSSIELQVNQRKQIILEDFCFDIDEGKRAQAQQLARWLAENALPSELSYWKRKLQADLALLSDDNFQAFVEMATEVITRIKLGEEGTVETGPWDEEHLPSETLLYSLALATDPKLTKDELNKAPIMDAEGVLNFLKSDLVAKAQVAQFGGGETVGKGLVRVSFFDKQQAKQGSPQGRSGGEEHDG